MPESWIDKDEQTIRADIIAVAKKHTGLTNFKSTGVLRGFLEVIVSIVSFIYTSAINVLYKNASLDGAEGFFLSLWGLMLGVVRDCLRIRTCGVQRIGRICPGGGLKRRCFGRRRDGKKARNPAR